MTVEIQDNIREKELVDLFSLKQPKNRSRIGVDAYLQIDKKDIPFEIKSTTMNEITTSRDVNLEHIKKWKKRHWLVGIYNKEAKLERVIYASPAMMRKWLLFIENDIKRGLKISEMIVNRIDMDMMVAIFGDKEVYSYKEAKFVYKRLYNRKQYDALKDKVDGYSKNRMLEMFKEHNWFYLRRGSSLNNPKISKKYYKSWPVVKDVSDLKTQVQKYLKENNG